MYATPTIRAIPATTQVSSCCTITLYSKELGLFFEIPNPGCGPVITQFPTCGPIDSPLLNRVELPPQARDVAAVVSNVAENARQTLPADLCVVSVNGGVVGMGTGVIASGVA